MSDTQLNEDPFGITLRDKLVSLLRYHSDEMGPDLTNHVSAQLRDMEDIEMGDAMTCEQLVDVLHRHDPQRKIAILIESHDGFLKLPLTGVSACDRFFYVRACNY